jgi:hypothetical protein
LPPPIWKAVMTAARTASGMVLCAGMMKSVVLLLPKVVG